MQRRRTNLNTEAQLDPSNITDCGKLRVLQIGQDDLFSSLPDIECEFIPTGNSITPQTQPRRPLSAMALLRMLGRFTGRQKWDLIVLPVLNLDWPHDSSALKRRTRQLARGMFKQRTLAQLLNSAVGCRAKKVVVLDRFDRPEIATTFLNAMPCVTNYFKTNLLIEQANTTLNRGDAICGLQHLPYWITETDYPLPAKDGDIATKDIDILFLGAVNSAAREHAVSVLGELKEKGYRCVMPTERMPFDAYLQTTARAWLTLSPEGIGYNGFRHFEAMLMGSLPVINQPSPAVLHDFVDGENCLLYDPLQLSNRLESALADKPQLEKLSAGLREFALAHHSRPAVGRHILDVVKEQIACELRAGRDARCVS